jgi:hypothetical protein
MATAIVSIRLVFSSSERDQKSPNVWGRISVCLIADLRDLMLCHACELIPVSFIARNLREISLIYFRLSSLLYLAVCLIAVKDWAKPPSDHVDPYHLGIRARFITAEFVVEIDLFC